MEGGPLPSNRQREMPPWAWGQGPPRMRLQDAPRSGHWESQTGLCRHAGASVERCLRPHQAADAAGREVCTLGPHSSCQPRCPGHLSDGCRTGPQSTLRCPVTAVPPGATPGVGRGGFWAHTKGENQKGLCSAADHGLSCLPNFPPFTATFKDPQRTG